MYTVGRHAGGIGEAGGFMTRLPAHERDLLMNSSVRCTFQHGESLFGVDNDRFAGVVTSGMVRVCSPLADGRQS